MVGAAPRPYTHALLAGSPHAVRGTRVALRGRRSRLPPRLQWGVVAQVVYKHPSGAELTLPVLNGIKTFLNKTSNPGAPKTIT